MLTENALVVSARGERAVVQAYRGEACHSCGAAGACKAMGGGKEMNVEVLNYVHAKPGDLVEIVLPETSFLKASLITYTIPLAFLVIGGLIGNTLGSWFGFSANAASIILALGGVAACLPLVARLNRKLTGDENYIPRITRVLPPDSEVITPGAGIPEAC